MGGKKENSSLFYFPTISTCTCYRHPVTFTVITLPVSPYQHLMYTYYCIQHLSLLSGLLSDCKGCRNGILQSRAMMFPQCLDKSLVEQIPDMCLEQKIWWKSLCPLQQYTLTLGSIHFLHLLRTSSSPCTGTLYPQKGLASHSVARIQGIQYWAIKYYYPYF